MKAIITLILLCFLSGNISAQNKNADNPYFFIQVTDPQFGLFESNKGFEKETELYEKAVVVINRLKPDFVVITGDLVNKKDDRAQIEEFKRVTATINPKIPVYYCPGNHDIGESPTKKDIDAYISDYGYDKFSFKHKKSIFIGLNSSVIKSDTPVLEQLQFDWLNKNLSKNKRAKHIVIFCHYPFFINKFDEPASSINIPVETRNKYFALFKDKNVEAIFAGHLHRNYSVIYGKIQMITTSAVGKPQGNDPSGIRIVKVYPDRIESFYYGLDEVPESIGTSGDIIMQSIFRKITFAPVHSYHGCPDTTRQGLFTFWSSSNVDN
jgi:3',5'-cyclic AMP phosphodiesterase CpdA